MLAYLAVEQAHPHRREALAGLFWPGFMESSARASLRHSLANLRQVLAEETPGIPFESVGLSWAVNGGHYGCKG